MELILLKDVEKLGKKGEVVNVRSGFGRNFLLPHSLALPASRENRVRLEAEKKRTAERKGRKSEEVEKLAKSLGSLSLCIEVAVGEKDKLFGAVTAQDVALAFKEKGFDLDKKQIHFSEPIKSLGAHTVIVELEGGVKTSVPVEIINRKKK